MSKLHAKISLIENSWHALAKFWIFTDFFKLFTIKQYKPLLRILDVGVNKKTIHLWMYIFHGNLEAIETTSFCDLYFLTEPLHLEEMNKHLQKHLWFGG